MTVPNRFSAHRRDRERLVRMGAIVGALAGCGVAAVMLLVVGSLIPMGVPYRIGLLLALIAGAVLALRLGGIQFWSPGDSGASFALGALWLVLGGTASMSIGVVPFLVGLVLAGAGGSAILLDRQGAPAPRATPVPPR